MFFVKIFSKKSKKYVLKIWRFEKWPYLCIVVTKVLQKHHQTQPLNYSYHEFEKLPNQTSEPSG